MQTLANAQTAPLRKFNFEYAFRPVYYFSRFAGLWPFTIIHDSNGKIQRARCGFFDVLWSILVICLYLTLVFFTYETLKREQAKIKNHTLFVVENIFEMSTLSFGALGIALNIINRNELADILRKFDTFDTEVSIFSI